MDNDPVARAQNALEAISNDAQNLHQHWLDYGHALNDLRVEHPSDEAFGIAVAVEKLDVLGVSPDGTHQKVKRDVRVAAMWAAANPEQLAMVRGEVTPRGGFRGLRAKWKKLLQTKIEKEDLVEQEERVEQAADELNVEIDELRAEIAKMAEAQAEAKRKADEREAAEAERLAQLEREVEERVRREERTSGDFASDEPKLALRGLVVWLSKADGDTLAELAEEIEALRAALPSKPRAKAKPKANHKGASKEEQAAAIAEAKRQIKEIGDKRVADLEGQWGKKEQVPGV